jgi:hypothetical protein
MAPLSLLLALSVQAPAFQSFPVDASVVPPSAFQPPAGVSVAASSDGGWSFAFQDYSLYDHDGNASTLDDAVLLNGNVFLDPFDVDLVLGTSPKVDLSNTMTTRVALEITGRHAAGFRETIPLATVPLPLIPITGTSVEIEPVLLLFVTVSGSVEAGFRAGYQREASWRMGVQFDRGAISAYATPADLASQPSRPEVSGNLAVGAEVAAHAGTAFVPWVAGAPLVGPLVAGSVSLGLDVRPLASPWWELTAGFSAVYGRYDLVTGPTVSGTLFGPATVSLASAGGANTGSGTGAASRWAKTYSWSANASVQDLGPAADGSGDLLVVGALGLADGFLLQLDEQGTTSWAFEVDRLFDAVDVSPTGDSFLAANGSTTGGGRVMRLDDQGAEVWERVLNGLAGVEMIDVAATADGGVVACGSVNLGSAFHQLVVRLDASGALVWANTYGVSYNEGLRRVWEMPNGDLLLAGSGKWSDSLGQVANANGVALRLDANGAVLWSRALGTTGVDVVESACPAGDGLLLVGSVDGEENAAWAARLDGSGNLLWSRVLAGEERGGAFDRIGGDTPWDGLRGAVALGGSVAGGDAGADGFLLLGDTSLGADADAWALRLGGLDASGALLWFRAYRGPEEDWMTAATPTASGGALLAGATKSWPAVGGGTQLLLVHASAQGGGRTDRSLGGDDLWELAQQNDTAGVAAVPHGLVATPAALTADPPLFPATYTPVTPVESTISE